MILRLAKNAVDPVRRAWEVQLNVSPVKVLFFWSMGNVNLLVQRSILPMKESANVVLNCVRNVFTMKYAQVLQRTAVAYNKIQVDLSGQRLRENQI